MNSLALESPAKLNLVLKVIGRYPNGYHKLVTLFHRISLRDQLILKKIKKGGIVIGCSDRRVPTGKDNLVAKAYAMLKEKFPALGGVSVEIRKKIPVGGGVAGGSSNAAFFLIGMKMLFNLPLSSKELFALGSRLGADVSFFLRRENQALGMGKGDELASRPLKRKLWFLLVLENKGLSTKKVYENTASERPAPSLTKACQIVKILCDFLDQGSLHKSAVFIQNDLEASAFQLRPSIQKTIAKMNRAGVVSARMSGSGPTVFAVCFNHRQAEELAQKMKKIIPGKRLVICHSF